MEVELMGTVVRTPAGMGQMAGVLHHRGLTWLLVKPDGNPLTGTLTGAPAGGATAVEAKGDVQVLWAVAPEEVDWMVEEIKVEVVELESNVELPQGVNMFMFCGKVDEGVKRFKVHYGSYPEVVFRLGKNVFMPIGDRKKG